MSDLGERVTRVEAGLDYLRKEAAEIKAEIKASRRWIIGTVIVAAIAILTVINTQIKTHGEHFQALIDAHQQTAEARLEEFRKVSDAHLEEFRKVSEARAEEFRRDSARNYDLALKALERSMAQPGPTQEPTPQDQPAPAQTPQDPQPE